MVFLWTDPPYGWGFEHQLVPPGICLKSRAKKMGKVTWKGWKEPEEAVSLRASIVMGRNLRKISPTKSYSKNEASGEVIDTNKNIKKIT